MDTIFQKFGESVRNLRIERGLSQEKLAFLCNLHRTYIGGIERGERNLSLRNIKAIASALDVSLSDLFKSVDDS